MKNADKNRETARSILRRLHLDRINGILEGLEEAWEEGQDIMDRLHEEVESACTYYWQCYDILYSTENDSAYFEEIGATRIDADHTGSLVTTLAYWALRQDVLDRVPQKLWDPKEETEEA